MKRLATAIAVIAQLGVAGQAMADITRGCTARFAITTADGSPPQHRFFGQYDAQGSCKNRRKANECRQRAAQYLVDCARSAWATRWDDAIRSGAQLPPDCIGRGRIGVRRYSAHDLKSHLEGQACSMNKARPFRVNLRVFVEGDTGCATGTELFRGYEITKNMC